MAYRSQSYPGVFLKIGSILRWHFDLEVSGASKNLFDSTGHLDFKYFVPRKNNFLFSRYCPVGRNPLKLYSLLWWLSFKNFVQLFPTNTSENATNYPVSLPFSKKLDPLFFLIACKYQYIPILTLIYSNNVLNLYLVIVLMELYKSF